MSLYRKAQQLSQSLHGANAVITTSELPLSKAAVQWRTSRQRLARPFRGFYLVGPTQPDLVDQCRAALALSSPVAVVGFHTAAALMGFGVVTSDDVHLVVPAGGPFPQRANIRVHQSVVPVAACLVRGVPCTSPVRTAIDLARALPRPEALAVLDAALAYEVCTHSELAAEVTRHQRLKGYRRALELVPLADGRSQCSQETHLRLILRDAKLTSFEPQVPVLDRHGRVRYKLDLADPRWKVAAEYDGESHLDRSRLRSDRARHNYLETHGWRMRYFTDVDVYQRPEEVIRTLRVALADAAHTAR